MTAATFNEDLMAFLAASPTPFHAVESMASRLLKAGFQRLDEADDWQLTPGDRYFVTRNDSSIIAFVYGKQELTTSGIRMVGAHTDSPCLKVKPHPELVRQGYFQLGVEVYGGALLNPWFDRDLSLAGRVSYRDGQGTLKSCLINFERPIAVIPSLAIHLDREANSKRTVNPQQHIPPVLMQVKEDAKPDFRGVLKEHLSQQGIADVDKVLDYELSFYDVQPPALVGLEQNFLASARLDNLLSCYIGLQSLLEADGEQSCLLVCNDHEEVGSASACGAQGPMLEQLLARWIPDAQLRLRAIDRSMMISADNAHAIHPNYADKHDGNHGPQINAGPVIKVNANQRYATNSETSAVFRDLCDKVDVPVQAFVTRTDLGCGSTIGPITASEVGVKTLDVGVPTFAMHSCRELGGVEDSRNLNRVLSAFFNAERIL
ncbi:M18 family aminopeptidase [Maricurvus nonylphenolicus]|uniref:M18 family aminopeptidase n=1 Tax=Maricurvus nonylphenolicus TaxID=1008307 RepID=UPI0036F1DD04